jgi:hypothetical protein
MEPVMGDGARRTKSHEEIQRRNGGAYGVDWKGMKEAKKHEGRETVNKEDAEDAEGGGETETGEGARVGGNQRADGVGLLPGAAAGRGRE